MRTITRTYTVDDATYTATYSADCSDIGGFMQEAAAAFASLDQPFDFEAGQTAFFKHAPKPVESVARPPICVLCHAQDSRIRDVCPHCGACQGCAALQGAMHSPNCTMHVGRVGSLPGFTAPEATEGEPIPLVAPRR